VLSEGSAKKGLLVFLCSGGGAVNLEAGDLASEGKTGYTFMVPPFGDGKRRF